MGNDIVDLKTRNAMGKSSDTRFVQRVLSTHEQAAVFRSDHPDALLWGLWAAKESAYKAVSKSYPDVSSAPGRFPVIADSEKTGNVLTGSVMTPKGMVAVRIDFHSDYVHCIGVTGPARNLSSIVYGMDEIHSEKAAEAVSISEQESVMARKLAKDRIASCLGVKEHDIQIIRHKKNNRIHPPMVYVNGSAKNLELSLSHDGRFAAYAFLAG